MDNNDIFLDEATKAVFIIGVRYRQADINGKQELRQSRDKAFSAYTIARFKLLKDEVVCTNEDVQEMEKIRQEIQQAAQTQTLIAASARLFGILIAL